MLVDSAVVVELKATPVMEPVFKAQCLTYTRMLGLKSGLVLNFGRVTLKEGIARVINETKAEYRSRLLKEDPRSFRNLLVEEDGVTPEEANRMQLAGDLGLKEGSGELPQIEIQFQEASRRLKTRSDSKSLLSPDSAHSCKKPAAANQGLARTRR